MNLKELKNTVDWLLSQCELSREDPEKMNVGISVKRIGQIGGTPIVNIKCINFGFDWDAGKIIVAPESDLREIDRDEFKLLQKKYDELGFKYLKKTKEKK